MLTPTARVLIILISEESCLYYDAIIDTYLIASRAPRLHSFSMMPATEQLLVLVEVDEVDQQLLANLAGETGRVPGFVGARAAGRHADVTAVHIFAALQKKFK